MATARLRRTFHYPSDSEDNDAVEEGMDEQDKQTLIHNLRTHDTASTNLYTRLLLLFPLSPTLLYLPRIFSFQTIIPSLLSITSLLATAYTLYFLPLPTSSTTSKEDKDKRGKVKVYGKRRGVEKGSMGVWATAPESRHPNFIPDDIAEVVRRYIIPANLGFCAVAAVVELAWMQRSWTEGVGVGGGLLPGLVLAVVLWARVEVRGVDLGVLEGK